MSHITSIRRGAGALGVGALVALSLAGPAAARELSKPGPAPTPASSADVRVWDGQHEYGPAAAPASSADVRVWDGQHGYGQATKQHPAPMGPENQRVYALHYSPGTTASPPDRVTVLASGGSLEYLQIGLGALGGAALVGAAAAAATARHRRAASPTTA